MPLEQSNRYKLHQPVVETDEFIVGFPLFGVEDLTVYVDGVLNELFSVVATFTNGRSDDAVIQLVTAVSGVDVEIYGTRTPRRDDDYIDNSPALAQRLQEDADRLTAVQQEQARDYGSTIRVSPNSPVVTPLSGGADDRAGRVVAFNETGLGLTVGPTVDEIENAQGYALAARAAADRAEAVGIFGSRSELFDWVADNTPVHGRLYVADGLLYLGQIGVTAIPDMLGLLPSGISHAEHFGAVGDGVTDDLPAIQAMLDYGGSAVLGANRSPGDVPVYRCSTTPVATVPITIRGTRKTDRLQIDNSNTEEGLFIKSSDVQVSNFEIMANAATGIENGTGDKGTCITISEWFTPPDDPEPDLVKNIVIDCMRFTRKTGSKSGHAISVLARTSGVLIEGCDFIGASNDADEGYHGDAILTHWGGHSHGVSTTQLDYDGQTSNFTPGATLTGATSGATAYIVYVDDDGATGTLWLKLVKGEFEDGETLTDNDGGAAVADGVQSVGLRQSRFEPQHYSFHPNNVTIRNCRLRNVGRFIACSASYSIHAENIDYLGPVQGGQLIDLPIGDEGATFAHPDDAGRVYTDFSFKNITGRMVTGTGANAVTAIDCSGFGTSKQTDADLAAYASAPYTDEPYAGVAHERRRLFKWENVVFENITYDAGPADPPSATPYVRTIYMRNLWGNFTFNNVNAVGRDEVLSLELVNVVGNYTFNSCDFTGGVVGDATETVNFRGCKIHNTSIEAGSQAVLWTGDRSTITVDGAVAAGSTVVPLTSGSPVRILIGQRIYFAGGMVTCAKYVEAGDDQLHISPLPIALTDLQVLTIDQWSRNLTFDFCDVSGGDEGFSINNTIGATVNQGSIRGAGQYGLLASTNSEVYVTGTAIANNGLRRLTEPSLTTSDIAVNPNATFIGDKIRFEQSDLVLHNISNSADAEKVSLTNSVFAGDPITAETSLNALANGSPIVFHSNTDALGVSILFSGEWTPVIEFVDGASGLTHDFQTGTFTVTDDRVMVEYDVRLTSKGAASGGILVSGLPHAAQNTPPNIGVVALYGASGLETGSCVTRMVSGKLRVYQQGATDLGGLSASNATDTLRLIGQTTYRRV